MCSSSVSSEAKRLSTSIQKRNRKGGASTSDRKKSLLSLILPVKGNPIRAFEIYGQRGYDSLSGRSSKGSYEEAKEGAIDKVSGKPRARPPRL